MKRFFSLITIIIIIIWMYGFLNFTSLIPSQKTVLNDFNKPQAIIVLTGGKYRIYEGLQLAQEDYVERVLITGVQKNISFKNILKEANLDLEAYRSKIDLGYMATNTYENAIEANEWVRKNDFTKIMMITGNYHIPRSFLEFTLAMPDIDITIYPVFPEYVKIEYWWKHFGTFTLLFSEYNKYLALRFRKAKNDFINR